jgi:hypothetical protein
MSFLNPWSLLWLASIPVLIQLWRLVSVRRRVVVPSLIPFEHLAARTPKRRGRLAVNALFWLQLAGLTGLALALAQPVIFRPREKLTLVLLDTSASMTAGDAFETARRSLMSRVARKSPTEQLFIMTTAPVLPLISQATSDGIALTRALEALKPTHLSGNLSTAERIGRALLGDPPDATLIITDEPAPETVPASVQWDSVGSPRPNAALVGLDAQGPLCSPADARVIATVQNFSPEPAAVTVRAAQGTRRLAEAAVALGPGERRSVSLALPEGARGAVSLSLDAPRDGLSLDNRAWLDVGEQAALPIAVRSDNAGFRLTLSSWLGACQALTWRTDEQPSLEPVVVVTDDESRLGPSDSAVLLFVPPARPSPVISHWITAPDHPVGAYLPEIGVTTAMLNPADPGTASGSAVVSALFSGNNIPVILADEREGRRVVRMRLDPSGSGTSTPVILAFFNSLRWLMGRSEARIPGEPIVIAGWNPGAVRVRRPDGTDDMAASSAGAVRYDNVTLSGVYHLEQGPVEADIHVNFFDPVESDLFQRVSTWRPLPETAPSGQPRRRVAHPLANLLTAGLLILMLVEWWSYSAKSNSLGVRGLGFGASAATPNPQPPTPNVVAP